MAFLLHQLLSESASKYPDSVALAYKDHTITYIELERESNKLAHTLVNLNIKKGDLNEGHYRLHPWLFDINRFIF